MTRLTNGFETGSNGTTITTGNSGGSGNDAFDAIPKSTGNNITFSNLREAHGTLGGFVSVASTGTAYTEWSTSMGTKTSIYARLYFNLDAFPSSAFRPYRLQNGTAAVAAVQLNANGKLSIYDSTNTLRGTSTTVLSADADYRVEVYVRCATSAGDIEARIYDSIDSSTALEVVSTSSANTGTQITKYQFGVVTGSGTAIAFYMDDIAVDDTDWIGPVLETMTGSAIGVARVPAASLTVESGGVIGVDLAGSAVGVAVGSLALATSGGSGSGIPDFATLYGTSPYVRLGTQADNTTQNNGLRDAASQERTDAANYWFHMHGEGGNFALGSGTPTLADQMTDLGVVVSEYRNGSYIPQSNNPPGETQYIEADPEALGISVFWPGNYGGPRDDTTGTVGRYTLASNLTSSGTTVSVRTVVSGNNNAPSSSVPSRLTNSNPPYVPNTWPYFQSKGTGNNTSTGTSRSIDYAGTWVVQQVNQGTNLTMINAALGMQGCVGYKPRIPWRDGTQLSVSLEPTQGNYNDTYLDQQLAIATSRGKMMVPRFMAGKYTPSWAMGTSPINYNGQNVPRPFNPSGGAPNATFISEWTALVQHLYAWARAKNTAAGRVVVPGIDLGWFGADYSENWFNALVRDLGGNTANTNAGYYVDACEELIVAAYATGAADGSDDLCAAWGLSGNGDIMNDYASLGNKAIAERQAEIIRVEAGSDWAVIAGMNANGWSPNGREWGQAVTPEAQLDEKVWPIKVNAGLQDIYGQIGPRTASHWITMYDQARNGTGMNTQPRAVYCEIYAPGFVVGTTAMNSADSAALAELQNQMQLHLAYFQTTGTDAASADTANCVSWIRVEDELMHVRSTPTFNSTTGVTTFTVARGLWGTTPTSHASGTKVMSPVYIGAAQGVDTADLGLSGTPVVHDTGKPIRYAIAIYTSLGTDWIADRIEATFTGGVGTTWKGYSAIWYDVSGANRYNQADAWAFNIEAWHLANGAPVNNTSWGQAQVYKFTRHRARGWVNNDGDEILFYENGAGQNYATWKAVNLDDAVDVGLSEKWADHQRATAAPIAYTSADVTTLFDVMATGRTMLFWLRWNRDPIWTNVDQGKRYGYALYLMAHRVGTNCELMGPFNAARLTGQTMNNHPGTIFANNQAVPPDDLFFWDWGLPSTNPTAITQLQVGSTAGLFRRDFSHGTVLLNMTATARQVDMGTTQWWNVMVLNTDDEPTRITSRTVTVPAYDALFLLNGSETGSATQLAGTAVGVAVASGSATVVRLLTGTAVGVAATGAATLTLTVQLFGTAVGVAVMNDVFEEVDLGVGALIGVADMTGTLGGGQVALEGEAVGVAVCEPRLRVRRRGHVRRDRKLPPP